MVIMKAWKNKKGNWVFEFERDQHEALRLTMMIGKAYRLYKEEREEYPDSFISAHLFDNAMGVIFVGSNYMKTQPTKTNPVIILIEQQIHNMFELLDNKQFTTLRFNKKELKIIRRKVSQHKINDLA